MVTHYGQLVPVGEAMGLAFNGNETLAEIGEIVANGVRQMLRDCGIKSAKESGIGRQELIDCTQTLIDLKLWFLQNTPLDVTPELIAEVFAKSWGNYQ